MNRHDAFPSIDKRGRLYTAVTFLPEPLRHFLTFDGERLVALDLKNSQPFHSCGFFRKDFWDGNGHSVSLKAVLPALYEQMQTTGTLAKIRAHIRLAVQCSDVKDYVEKTVEGQYYEYLGVRYGGQFPELAGRENAKKSFMVFMNQDNNRKSVYRNNAYEAWAMDFPNVATLFELIKETDHTFLSKILQALEAKMLLIKVVKAFVKNNPGSFVTSVHDSLLTLVSKQQELEIIIRKVYAREFGYVPRLEIKKLQPENAYRDLPRYIERKMQSFLNHKNLNNDKLND